MIVIKELCHRCWLRKVSTDCIVPWKFTSDHISRSSFRKGLHAFEILFVSFKLRFPLKTIEPPSCSSSESKKSFHFPQLFPSKYFFIQIDFSALLKDVMSIIFKPPSAKFWIITFLFILSPLLFQRKLKKRSLICLIILGFDWSGDKRWIIWEVAKHLRTVILPIRAKSA